MYWYYMEGDQQVGPLTDQDLQERVRHGRIGMDTLVWNEQMPAWQAYGSVLRPPVQAPAAALAACSQCGRQFPQQDLIHYENQFICANCKPIYFQRLKEGGAPASGAGVWRDQKKLVMDKNANLPGRCVKCNAPAQGQRLKRSIYWHPPAIYLLICAGVLLYAIVALIVRKSATIHVGMCADHLQKRKIGILASWGIVVLSAIAFVVGANQELPALLILGLILFFAAVVYGIRVAQPVTAAKMTDQHVWLNGVCIPYLEELPPYSS